MLSTAILVSCAMTSVIAGRYRGTRGWSAGGGIHRYRHSTFGNHVPGSDLGDPFRGVRSIGAGRSNHRHDSSEGRFHEGEWRPYHFGYQTHTEDGATSREEKTDQHGRVSGHYTIMTADGRKRKVSYEADEHGFRAKVDTNEPGTASEDPASVHFNSSAGPVKSSPVPYPRYGQWQSGGQSGQWQQSRKSFRWQGGHSW